MNLGRTILCPICGKWIYGAKTGQKYHQDGCNKTAAEIQKLKSLMNSKFDKLLQP